MQAKKLSASHHCKKVTHTRSFYNSAFKDKHLFHKSVIKGLLSLPKVKAKLYSDVVKLPKAPSSPVCKNPTVNSVNIVANKASVCTNKNSVCVKKSTATCRTRCKSRLSTPKSIELFNRFTPLANTECHLQQNVHVLNSESIVKQNCKRVTGKTKVLDNRDNGTEICGKKNFTVDTRSVAIVEPTKYDLALLSMAKKRQKLENADISRAFKQVPIDPRDIDLLGLFWGAYYIENRLVFGYRNGSALYQ